MNPTGRACEICGDPLVRTSGERDGPWLRRRFCSCKCWGESQKRSATIKWAKVCCEVCGGPAGRYDRKAMGLAHTYCSRACRNVGARVPDEKIKRYRRNSAGKDEHRAIMKNKIGAIYPGDVVHHIDWNPKNN